LIDDLKDPPKEPQKEASQKQKERNSSLISPRAIL